MTLESASAETSATGVGPPVPFDRECAEVLATVAEFIPHLDGDQRSKPSGRLPDSPTHAMTRPGGVGLPSSSVKGFTSAVSDRTAAGW